MTELLSTEYYKLVDGRHGRFLSNPQDIYLGRSMIKYGEFSELEWNLLDQLVQPGSIVIEAGANMGAFTVPLAKKVQNTGMVFAFEPQLIVFQQMCANLALNDLVNVQAFNSGCGDEPSWMTIARPHPATQNNFGGLSLSHLATDKSINKVRIDKLDDILDVPRLNLLKADVEGMEAAVLRGARELIRKHRPILYVEAHHPDDTPELIREVLSLDYDLYWHLPLMFNPNNHANDSENLFDAIKSRNILCTPSERKVNVGKARAVTGEDDHPTKWTS